MNILLKNKNKDSILDALTKFFRTHHPEIIISDNDTGFNSHLIKKLFDTHESENYMVEPNDHKALGIIDRAIQTIKNVIYKYMKQENTTSYYKALPFIIEAYNNTPNSGIFNVAIDESVQSPTSFKIYDALGTLIISFTANNPLSTIDLSSYSTGVYILEINSDKLNKKI